ncbi:MAG: 3-isopropylmalate dehydratase large subunit [Nitrososphaerota archaeon]|nr:3-isopropylmalate dehydratase large subunit [Candidatus Calditenuaceae archaeon]MDW8073689.1 3-isopropylmalate dehydratase large subunit [Nitrososphaerota archaeon]
MSRTVLEKIWDDHVLARRGEDEYLLYVDRHLTHEVTSPIAFEGLRARGRRVRRPDLTFALMDHNVPTVDRALSVRDEHSREQMRALARNAMEFSITLFDYFSPWQGIVHVVGPELGLTLPGITIVCGDSHTSTHGALGALAFGIGTSEGEHVFATQTVWLRKPRQMEVVLEGRFQGYATPKDAILYVIRELGTGGMIGHATEFRGEAVKSVGVEERMTLCNMAIEGGARTAIVEPDDKVYRYLEGAPYAPSGEDWEEAKRYWDTLKTDGGARFDRSYRLNVSKLEPQITWGTNPAMCIGVSESVPDPKEVEDQTQRRMVERALSYMGLKPGQRIEGTPIDAVFIGSCTNARLSDLVMVARLVKGRKVSPDVRAMIVPGSMLVKRRAERMGLHRIFMESGFEWRNSGCSMCIAMNEDRLGPGERGVLTSNRNFENRAGPGSRVHLASPLTAAASALEGKIADPRNFDLVSLDELELEWVSPWVERNILEPLRGG